jgi:hypothetical protein
MRRLPKLESVVKDLCLDKFPTEDTEAKRKRVVIYDDNSDDEDGEPVAQQPNIAPPELEPLPDDSATALFVGELPDPMTYPQQTKTGLVDASVLPGEDLVAAAHFQSALRKLKEAKKKMDENANGAEDAYNEQLAALPGIRDAARDAELQHGNQNVGNRHTEEFKDIVRKRWLPDMEALIRKIGSDPGGVNSYAALMSQLKPGKTWNNLVKQTRLKRQQQPNYQLRPHQLPPLSDPRTLGVAVYKVIEQEDLEQWRKSMRHATEEGMPEFKKQVWWTPEDEHWELRTDGNGREYVVDIPAQAGPTGGVPGQPRSIWDWDASQSDPRSAFYPGTAFRFVGGGFAALNNPSSFHNQFVRSLRMHVHGMAIFRDLFGMGPGGNNEGATHLEQVIDRMLIRQTDQSPGEDFWHRDIALGTNPNDRVFGGWVNLNNTEQAFSCVPGSSAEERVHTPNDPFGFAKIAEDDHYKCVARSYKVMIPPGHMIVFNEDTIHEVMPSHTNERMLRLFTGWRLSQWQANGPSPKPLIPDLRRRLLQQEGMPLKSGQHKHYDSDDPSKGGKDYYKQNMDQGRKYNKANNPKGFKNYPGPPPFYPSNYWGTLDPNKHVGPLCDNLEPALVHNRFFPPNKPMGIQHKFGVMCNLDYHHITYESQYSANVPKPSHADTLRGLVETHEWLRDFDDNNINIPNGKIYAKDKLWVQEPYTEEEIDILEPHTLAWLRKRLLSTNCANRASPYNYVDTKTPQGGNGVMNGMLDDTAYSTARA